MSAALVLALVIQSPAIGGSFYDDDYAQLAAARGVSEPSIAARSRFDLYRFFSGDPKDARVLLRHGAVPWWFEPTTQMAFLRPLSSALMVADATLFGLEARYYHLHSLLWYAAFVISVWLVAKRVTPRSAGLAALLFAASQYSAGLAVVWWCNRHLIVSGTLGCLALWAYMRWRNDGWRPGKSLASLGFVLALASGESGMLSLAYLGAFELIGAKVPWKSRLRALFTLTVFAVSYLLARSALGCGTRNEYSYCDPLREPGRFLREVAIRWPKLFLSMWSGGVDAPLQRRAGTVTAAVFFVTLLVVVCASTFVARTVERRALAWIALGTALSLALATTSPATILQTPTVGVAIASAALLVGAFDAARRDDRGWRWRAFAVSSAVVLLGSQALCAAYFARREMEIHSREQRIAHQEIVEADVDPGARQVVAIGGRTVSWAALAAMNLFRRDLSLRAWWGVVLNDSNTEMEVTRSGPKTIEIACNTANCSLVELPNWFRGPPFSMSAGDEVTLDGLRIRVVSSSLAGPGRIELAFDSELNLRSTSFVAFDGAAFRRVRAPEVGGKLPLQYKLPLL
jgi:hypothetical protein